MSCMLKYGRTFYTGMLHVLMLLQGDAVRQRTMRLLLLVWILRLANCLPIVDPGENFALLSN